MLREEVKETNGIKKIRFTDRIESSDGRKRTKMNLYVEKILETPDMKPSQHVDVPVKDILTFEGSTSPPALKRRSLTQKLPRPSGVKGAVSWASLQSAD